MITGTFIQNVTFIFKCFKRNARLKNPTITYSEKDISKFATTVVSARPLEI